MTKWLLTAEADKIQDFIFRSSRLAQVVGGSGLLTRFCHEALPPILAHHKKINPNVEIERIIADGGRFLLCVDDHCTDGELGKNVAQAVGDDLAEAYYRVLDSTLTVAEPQLYGAGGFKAVSQKARGDLRLKKSDRRARVSASAHSPYTALCASCGTSLAMKHAKRHTEDVANFLCDACQRKAADRDQITRQPEGEFFLRRFLAALETPRHFDQLPDELRKKLKDNSAQLFPTLLPSDAEAVGAYDPRKYVAYIVADGNGMGVLFSQCDTEEKLRKLSEALSEALWQALAAATVKIAGQLWKSNPAMPQIPFPVTPLIMGGDDLFALLPAPYALDAARQICLAFEDNLRPIMKAFNFTGHAPTMSAAVVICKQNYPYALAHHLGEALLAQTKKMGRVAQLKDKIHASLVNFAVVRGSDIDTPTAALGRKYITPTLRPYWVKGSVEESTPSSEAKKADGYARILDNLLEARYAMRNFPGKRRDELKRLFSEQLPKEHDAGGKSRGRIMILGDLSTHWKPAFQAIQDRVARRNADAQALDQTLDWLGSSKKAEDYYPWEELKARPLEPLAHGLLDLLEVWHFSQALKYNLEMYEGSDQ